jgi:hypothetical protein
MLWVGIDPGEKHCGFAALEITSDEVIRVESRTYDVAAHGGYLEMAKSIVDLLPHARRANVVCEDFRIRKAGHQRFSSGDTLRMIGAIEMAVRSLNQYEFALIPPADAPDAAFKLFGKIIVKYKAKWPRTHHPNWLHCLSAWRVLGLHLMSTTQDTLMQFHDCTRVREVDRWLPTSALRTDHVADAMEWI